MALDTTDDTETAVATPPPADIAAQAVAPVVLAQATAPVVKDKTGSVVARPGTASGMSSAYSDAAQSGDPDQMLQFAKIAQGTEFEKPAMNAWRGMANRVSQFDQVTNAIDKKGGPNTAEGKLELANQWAGSKFEPDLGKAISQWFLGDPNARYYVSQGMIKPKIIYDKSGAPLQQNWTENGIMKNVIDPITGKEVLPDEYKARGAGLGDYKETLPYIADVNQLKMNQEAAFKAQDATNGIGAAAPQLAILHNMAYKGMQDLMTSYSGVDPKTGEPRQLKDLLSPQERSQLASFHSRVAAIGATSSQGINALDQYTRNGGQSLSDEQKKALAAYLSPLGYGVDASGSVVDKKNQHVDMSKLKSLQQSGSLNANFENTFQQNKDEAMNSAILKKLTPQQQQQYGAVMDMTKQIEQKKLELSQKYGADANLPFLINPVLPNMGDQYARFQTQQTVGQANAEITKDYADYRRDMMKNYPAGTAPSPGEIELAYSKTPRFLKLRDELRNNVIQELKRVNTTPNTKGSVTDEIAGKNPEAGVNKNKPALPPIDTNMPTQSKEPPAVPALNPPASSSGFKVLKPSDRTFIVKEPK